MNDTEYKTSKWLLLDLGLPRLWFHLWLNRERLCPHSFWVGRIHLWVNCQPVAFSYLGFWLRWHSMSCYVAPVSWTSYFLRASRESLYLQSTSMTAVAISTTQLKHTCLFLLQLRVMSHESWVMAMLKGNGLYHCINIPETQTGPVLVWFSLPQETPCCVFNISRPNSIR